jgi:nitrile hydratase accessory protein
MSDRGSISTARRALVGGAAWPGTGDEPVFDQPWEGRAFAVAVELVEARGLSWEDFRDELVAAIDAEPGRPYYEAWVHALERVVMTRTTVDAASLARHRARAASYRYEEAGTGDLEVFPVAAEEQVLHRLLTDLLVGWWDLIRFGPLIQGAVYELRFDRAPELSMLDGYLTIDAGSGHVHVCIGPHVGTREAPVSPELAARRRCRHAELYRVWVDGSPCSWGFRMFNGDDHQQLAVLLPNPFLDSDDQPVAHPDWERLACWDALRARYLGLAPDPADRSGTRFRHG